MDNKTVLLITFLLMLAACSSTVGVRAYQQPDDFYRHGVAPKWFTEKWEITR